MQTHTGFTLVELVVVIVLLSILSAVAVPRYLDISDDAHKSVVKAVAGTLTSSVEMARNALFVIEGGGPAEEVQVFPGGIDGRIDFNAQGWPSQQFHGPLESNPTLNNINDCLSVWSGLLGPSSVTASRGADGDFQAEYNGNGACTYTYNDATRFKITYNSNNGTVRFIEE